MVSDFMLAVCTSIMGTVFCLVTYKIYDCLTDIYIRLIEIKDELRELNKRGEQE